MRRALVLLISSLVLASTAAPAVAASGDRVALIIGVDHFEGLTRSNIGAVGDAMDMRDLLLKHGWPADRIRVLIDGDATQAAIRVGMQWLVDNCTPGSMCVFHYSGHVKQMPGPEGINEYLWPHDNRFISDEEFAGYMRRLNGYAWIDIAGCEAAGFDNGVSGPHTLFTAASQENEKGYEYPAWSNSVWTGLVVDEGMLKGYADVNGDGNVTLGEALRYGIDRAPSMTSGQPTGPQNPYVAGGGLELWFPAPGSSVALAAAAPAKHCILLFLCF